VNPGESRVCPGTQKQGWPVARPGLSALGCQLGVAGSLDEGAIRATGRSLLDMSLAFALMAAISGSTGSSATLSYGLFGTKPRRRQSGGAKILNAQG
jgi:hypothetical protein